LCAGTARAFDLLALEVASPGGLSRDSIGVCQLIRESIEKSIVGSDENQHQAQRRPILYAAPTGFNLRQGQACVPVVIMMN
jgi:hypothetical protein